MSLILYDYQCTCCVQERLVRSPAPDNLGPCPECGDDMRRQFPCPAVQMPFVTVETGSRSSAPERPPHALDTRPLAEGMDWGSWKQKQQAKHRDRIDREVKKSVGDYRTRIFGGSAAGGGAKK